MTVNKSARKGIAVVVVVFFAFAIGIIMFFMLRSNTNLNFQTKMALYELQANYLAHSAMQFGKLHIYLLPREIYEYYKADSGGNCLDKCESSNFPSMALSAFYDLKAKYDLFDTSKSPDNAFPYGGDFAITKCEHLLANEKMKMVQDSYRISVVANVKSGRDKEKGDSISEEFIVSRYSGR